jgi:DTW domain-containing protein
MNLKTYLEKRSMRLEPAVRRLCTQCRLAAVVCDCARLKPFDARIKFVILIHPEEVRRRIATGRLSHLMLKNSDLIEGESFEACARVLNP